MSENYCMFCKIDGEREEESEIVHEEEGVGRRIFVAQEVAEKMGLAGPGYVFRINNGNDAGQEVFHLHAHVMGGERLEM